MMNKMTNSAQKVIPCTHTAKEVVLCSQLQTTFFSHTKKKKTGSGCTRVTRLAREGNNITSKKTTTQHSEVSRSMSCHENSF